VSVQLVTFQCCSTQSLSTHREPASRLDANARNIERTIEAASYVVTQQAKTSHLPTLGGTARREDVGRGAPTVARNVASLPTCLVQGGLDSELTRKLAAARQWQQAGMSHTQLACDLGLVFREAVNRIVLTLPSVLRGPHHCVSAGPSRSRRGTHDWPCQHSYPRARESAKRWPTHLGDGFRRLHTAARPPQRLSEASNFLLFVNRYS